MWNELRALVLRVALRGFYFAVVQFFCELGQLIECDLASFEFLNAGLRGLAAAALALLRHIALIVSHKILQKLRLVIVADQEKDARLAADFRGKFE
jgi:hypothetical protein